MSTAEDKAQQAIEDYVATVRTIKNVREEIAEELPEASEILDGALTALPKHEKALKDALRTLGHTSVEFEDFVFSVSFPKTVTVDVDSVVETATQRGHLDTLVKRGFLKFRADAGQLERLPNTYKEMYEEFVSTKSGTPRVLIPKGLKV